MGKYTSRNMNIQLRECTLLDAQAILNLRNANSARRYSKNSTEIALEEHTNWFRNRILRADLEPIWILEVEDRLAGVIRFDLIRDEESAFEVSIIVGEGQEGKGLGYLALTQAIQKLKSSFDPRELVAEIHEENVVSMRLFLKLGFRKDRRRKEFFILRLPLG